MPYRFYVYLLTLLIGTLIGLFRFTRLPKPLQILTILLFFTFVSESFTRLYNRDVFIYTSFGDKMGYWHSSFPQYHFFTILRFSIVAFLYYICIDNKIVKKIIFVAAPAYAGMVLLNSIFLQPLNKFPSNVLTIENVLIILFALLLFRQLLLNNKFIALKRSYLFWLNAGMLFFTTCIFVIFGVYNYLLSDNSPVKKNITNIQYYLNIFQYCTFVSILLFYDPKRQNKQT